MIKAIKYHIKWNWPIYFFAGLIIGMIYTAISTTANQTRKHAEYIKELKSKTSEFDLLIDVMYRDEMFSREEIKNLKAYALVSRK